MSRYITFAFVVVVLVYVFLLNRLRIADPSNGFNQSYRSWFLKSEIARRIFFMDRPGDGRFEYFSGADSVMVEVDYQSDYSPSSQLEVWIEDLMQETLGKKAEIELSREEKIPDASYFSDKELIRLAADARDLEPEENQAYLHVLYVSRSSEAESNTGLVLTADELFIFKDQIMELSDKSGVRDLIEQSTIKHEFGHLLGLEHVADIDCVMNERVEVYERQRYQFDSVPLEFCQESLREIKRMRSDGL